MSTKRYPLIEGKVYHVFTKSIAGFKIFRNDSEYEGMRELYNIAIIGSCW